jgi:DNA polymerase-1
MTVSAGINIPVLTEFHDTMILAQIVWQGRKKYGLKELIHDLGIERQSEDLEIKIMMQQGKQQEIDQKILAEYQREDAKNCMLLFQLFFKELNNNALLDYKEEIKTVLVTALMEHAGITYSQKDADNLKLKLQQDKQNFQTEIYTFFGSEFNIRSHKILTEKLRDKNLLVPEDELKLLLQLDEIDYSTEIRQAISNLRKDNQFIKYTTTDKSSISVGKAAFHKYKEKKDHPIFKTINQYRTAAQALSIIDGYEYHLSAGNMIYPNIYTNSAITSRQSCRQPNFQNIQKDRGIPGVYSVPLLQCFGTEANEILLMCDYSAIELRLIAEVTQEQELLQIINAGIDPHPVTMQCFLSPARYKQLEENKKEFKNVREIFKSVFFAKCYGAQLSKIKMVLTTIAEQYTIDIDAGFNRFVARFPKATSLSTTYEDSVKKRGCIVCPFGRKIEIERRFARKAGNYIIQRTAAGVMKRAENRLFFNLLLKGKEFFPFKCNPTPIMTIHDALVIRYPKNQIKTLPQFIENCNQQMAEIEGITVKLKLDWKYSDTTWNEKKEIHCINE